MRNDNDRDFTRKMNRFILFAFEHYYPEGGLHDAWYDTDVLEDAIKFIDKLMEEQSLEYFSVFDCDKRMVVYRSRYYDGKLLSM